MEGLNGRIKQWRGTDQKCSRGFGGIGFFVPACSWLWPLPMAIRWRKKWPLPESEKVRKKPWATATDSCSSSCYPSWDRRSSFLSNQRKELIETVWSFFKRYRIQADFFQVDCTNDYSRHTSKYFPRSLNLLQYLLIKLSRPSDLATDHWVNW